MNNDNITKGRTTYRKEQVQACKPTAEVLHARSKGRTNPPHEGRKEERKDDANGRKHGRTDEQARDLTTRIPSIGRTTQSSGRLGESRKALNNPFCCGNGGSYAGKATATHATKQHTLLPSASNSPALKCSTTSQAPNLKRVQGALAGRRLLDLTPRAPHGNPCKTAPSTHQTGYDILHVRGDIADQGRSRFDNIR